MGWFVSSDDEVVEVVEVVDSTTTDELDDDAADEDPDRIVRSLTAGEVGR